MGGSYRGIAERFHRFWMLRKIKIQSLTGDFSCRFGQFPLLGYVEQHDGCTQQEAAEAMSVSAPAVAVSVKRL
ncbi:MAG TPA: helix-turn-helix domain-containing protein, partial [Oscillospiraceae bacterium]|nr:helix-turn-helix domain-containing protein [Oscillospiraceae bacterium]